MFRKVALAVHPVPEWKRAWRRGSACRIGSHSADGLDPV